MPADDKNGPKSIVAQSASQIHIYGSKSLWPYRVRTGQRSKSGEISGYASSQWNSRKHEYSSTTTRNDRLGRSIRQPRVYVTVIERRQIRAMLLQDSAGHDDNSICAIDRIQITNTKFSQPENLARCCDWNATKQDNGDGKCTQSHSGHLPNQCNFGWPLWVTSSHPNYIT